MRQEATVVQQHDDITRLSNTKKDFSLVVGVQQHDDITRLSNPWS